MLLMTVQLLSSSVHVVGIGLDTATKEFLAIEFKRTQDARSNYVERGTAVAQEQYKSLLTGLGP
jgi:hypothetical protein